MAACSSGSERSAPSLGGPGAAHPPDARTLNIAIRVEPVPLTFQRLQAGANLTLEATRGLFNAHLALVDEVGAVLPQLAETLPTLNTDSWRLFPDGRMETTYRLRPGLTWHDNTPLRASDFAFALRVYLVPEFGLAKSPPQSLMEELLTPDERTVVIRWRQTYPDAGTLGIFFPALPQHLLGDALQSGSSAAEAFATHPYWSTDYVGLGPFRLERWEPGSFLEASAFANYALGRPRISRLKLLFIGDPNTVLANLLADTVHLTFDDAIRFQQGAILQREWSRGVVVLYPQQVRYTEVQLKTELVNPRAMQDLRVRRAMAYMTDKQALIDTLLDGVGIPADTIISPRVDYFDALDRTVAKYPYDPRRSAQLLDEAGFTRASDGFYAGRGGEPFEPELRVRASAHNEAEMAIMVDTWRRAGVAASGYVIPAAQSLDRVVIASFPALSTTSRPAREEQLFSLISSAIPTPENRWSGTNRGGWANAEYDRLADLLAETLDRGERNQRTIQMMRLFSEDLPGIFLYYNVQVVAHAASLIGPQAISAEGYLTWNAHLWEWR